ncbi:metal-dependent hydrolase [Natrinema salaciae]|uniref:LexA-binding, inner membrane-associated putative hydrolase n=1 Tax=Natrinema salaciae TaxID=1186196 RepID=A0A1H9E9I9_9EURY|nr:metal-dependent hydrolase [Natrinema salaciae]SEQ22242.1 LexA-binding, inner membrane-associated putative hydrolase [Natrinema salaciae]
MFVGHALLAFAVAALVADWQGWERRSALAVGVVAGAFAAIPDIDVAYALVGLLEWQVGDGALGASTAFWDASRVVHRSVTHSLVVGAVAAPAFGLLAVRGRSDRARFGRIAGVGLLVTLLVIALVWDGSLAVFVMGLFAVSGILVARGVARASTLSPATVAVAALWGLWSHPWGDLVTGAPPDWLFPFPSPVLESRVVLHSNPTLHLLGAFAIELATIWFALAVYCRLTDRSPLASVDRRATVGAAYGVAALAATPPTLEVSYHFVFSILGVGLLCGVVRETPSLEVPRASDRGLPSPDGVLEVALTALTAVTIALAAYATVYVLAVSA